MAGEYGGGLVGGVLGSMMGTIIGGPVGAIVGMIAGGIAGALGGGALIKWLQDDEVPEGVDINQYSAPAHGVGVDEWDPNKELIGSMATSPQTQAIEQFGGGDANQSLVVVQQIDNSQSSNTSTQQSNQTVVKPEAYTRRGISAGRWGN